jgi:phenylpropionate dioxygenase-like ring-hydroxylating dioxygenase large terminal subunit
MYIRNAWYVGAWDHEVTRTLKRRIILDEPVLLFRKDDGTAVALEDRCCHRQAQLSMGKLIGNILQCPYHGLQFDTTGKCVKVPSQDLIPKSAKVRAFPVVEKNHWIWIWMGDPAKADPALVEDFHFMDDPAWRFGGNYLHVDANTCCSSRTCSTRRTCPSCIRIRSALTPSRAPSSKSRARATALRSRAG